MNLTGWRWVVSSTACRPASRSPKPICNTIWTAVVRAPSRYTTQRREPDQVRILSGVFEGVTTGTSIGLIIENTDQRSQDYSAIKDVFRPGHADYTYEQKYGLRDYRGGGRSSARETAMRVAAGAIAKKYLQQKFGVQVRGYLAQIGDVTCELKDWDQVEQNPFFCPDPDKLEALDELMRALKKRATPSAPRSA